MTTSYDITSFTPMITYIFYLSLGVFMIYIFWHLWRKRRINQKRLKQNGKPGKAVLIEYPVDGRESEAPIGIDTPWEDTPNFAFTGNSDTNDEEKK